jgi:deoxycytidylate deaminase
MKYFWNRVISYTNPTSASLRRELVMIRQAFVAYSTSYARLANTLSRMHVTAVVVSSGRMASTRLAAVPRVDVPVIFHALVTF